MPWSFNSTRPICWSIRARNSSSVMSRERLNPGQSLTWHMVQWKLQRLTFSTSSLMGR